MFVILFVELKELKSKLNRLRLDTENLPENRLPLSVASSTVRAVPSSNPISSVQSSAYSTKPAVGSVANSHPQQKIAASSVSTKSSSSEGDPDSLDQEALQTMHRTLDATITAKKSTSTPSSQCAAVDAGPWVFKWVDYSNKYGLGYELTDGSIGAFFNDNTKIIMTSDEK
jgi:hypothetical protein